MSCIL